MNSPVLRRGVGTNKVFLACVTKEVITLKGGEPLKKCFYCPIGLHVVNHLISYKVVSIVDRVELVDESPPVQQNSRQDFI